MRNLRSQKLLLAIALACCLVIALASSAASAKQNLTSTNGQSLSDFKIIAEKNIFNPKRYVRSTGSQRKETARVGKSDTLALTGTMVYEKGRIAFFDGSSSSFQKVIKNSGEIAGMQVKEIDAQSVRLQHATNALVLKVGHQLKRSEGGPWLPGGEAEFASTTVPLQAQPPAPPTPSQEPPPDGPPEFITQMIENVLGGGTASPPPATPSPTTGIEAGTPPPTQPAAPASSEDEVLRRLMQRREQEQNQ